VTGLFWKPFDSQFQEILERIDLHQKIVRHEVLVSTFVATQNVAATNERMERIRALEKNINEIERAAQTSSRTTVEGMNQKMKGVQIALATFECFTNLLRIGKRSCKTLAGSSPIRRVVPKSTKRA
jgi:hypothetical protein